MADDAKPWAEGVAQEQQDKALAIYRSANDEFEQANYVPALEKYQQALAIWDHPAIRYNAAVCLINLARPDEAYEDLIAALRFGEAPLGHDLFKQGQTYKALLEGQLGHVEIKCNQAQATVRLDGKQLLSCPGTESRFVRPGPHQIVGSKPGYQDDSRPIEPKAGQTLVVVLELKQLGATGHLERRWARWLPWTIMATGAVVGIASVPMYLGAKSADKDWDTNFKAYCPSGCASDLSSLSPDQKAKLDSLDATSKRDEKLAVAATVVGGAALAVGFTMVILNQPRLVKVSPTIGNEHAGLSLSGSF